MKDQLAIQLQQHAFDEIERRSMNDEHLGYWDWLYNCHDIDELVTEFVRSYKTLDEILKSKEMKLFFRVMKAQDLNSRWEN
tara:strand:+ start:1734 stop:1976 length:243 start_codon:yes stop_codon:yes gene_type:complete